MLNMLKKAVLIFLCGQSIIISQVAGVYKIAEMNSFYYDYYNFVVLINSKSDTLFALSPCFTFKDTTGYSGKMQINGEYEMILLPLNNNNEIKLKDIIPLTPGIAEIYNNQLITEGNKFWTEFYLILNTQCERIAPIDWQKLKNGTLWRMRYFAD